MDAMALILGLESSCDETAAALVTSDRRILAHRLARQEAMHRPYGGVVPEIAARAHVEVLGPLVEEALDEAGVTLADVDAIAATAGPGLIGGVMVGLVTGKALALASGKPLVAVNHLEGHGLSPRLSDPDPLVRGAAVWAVRRLVPAQKARHLALDFLAREADTTVRSEWTSELV